MKKLFLYIIALLIVIGLSFVCWHFGRILNYKIAYESMIKETCKVEIEKVLKERLDR